ncbi:MAG: type II toxin-antitoxin system HicA family toxin [Azoarcus sp.]|jgi:hypothetical protein|nr:type II toxin-antitoxin system HicA family toxin [Azoarcus sp.]
MNSKHRKTLVAIFADPINGALEWARIESLLLAVGCTVTERAGSAVMFSRDGFVLQVHRPHPQRDALRYRVREVREFLRDLGVVP